MLQAGAALSGRTLLSAHAGKLVAGRGGGGAAILVAVPLGLLIGRYRWLDLLTDWSIQFFRAGLGLICGSHFHVRGTCMPQSLPRLRAIWIDSSTVHRL